MEFGASNTKCGTQGLVNRVMYNGEIVVRKRMLCYEEMSELDMADNHIICDTLKLERDAGLLVNTLNCDHFCKFIKASPCRDPQYLLFSCIDGPSMHRFITQKAPNGVSKKAITRSLTGRVLSAAAIMNEELGLFHNDLHSNNVMIESTEYDVQAYIFPDGEEFSFRTFGVNPVIIDFGLCFIESGKRMVTNPMFTFVGIFPHVADRTIDARRIACYAPYSIDVPEEMEQNGLFSKDTFPDFVTEVFEKHEMCYEFMYVFMSRIELPLKKSRYPKDYVLEIKALEDEIGCSINNLKMDELKKIMAGTSEKYAVKKKLLKSRCNNVVLAIKDLYCDYVERIKNRRQSFLDSISIKTVRDAVKLTFRKHEFNDSDILSVYNVKTRTKHVFKLTALEVAKLNSGEMLISDLIVL